MSEFDRIIGYETIKDELRQICDMIHHPEVYGKLGAFTVRRDSSDGEFINSIAAAFRAAEEAAPEAATTISTRHTTRYGRT